MWPLFQFNWFSLTDIRDGYVPYGTTGTDWFVCITPGGNCWEWCHVGSYTDALSSSVFLQQQPFYIQPKFTSASISGY